MSEYQYYEFQAVDRPLGAADREALRAISSRATITSASFKNSYEWGDLKGDPVRFMERWFDLHLYLANWASRRLMIRVPARLVDRALLNDCIRETDEIEVREAGANLILDIGRDEVEAEDWDDGEGWLAALAPLRADLLAGDQRLFYLFWLMAVECNVFTDETAEPLPGLGPVSASLMAFVEFFGIDRDLVMAAAERSPSSQVSLGGARTIVDAMDAEDKTALLMRLLDGDPHVGADLTRRVRFASKVPAPAERRTVAELRARAAAVRQAREIAAQEAAAAAQARKAAAEAKARRGRLDDLKQRGNVVWREVETEIERRNAAGYEAAASVLRDLRDLAGESGTTPAFVTHIAAIRSRHASKRAFLNRLDGLDA